MMAGSARRKPAIRAATQPPTTKAKNAPPTLKISVIIRTPFQLAAFETSWAPTANPIRPMMSPTASAASAPTTTALQTTGHGLQPGAYGSMASPSRSEVTQSTCRLLCAGGPVGPAQPAQRGGHVGGALDVHFDPSTTTEAPVGPGAGGQRSPLLVGPQPDPEVVLFLANGEACEQRLAHEVAPAPEHRRDPHAGPAAELRVETAGSAGAPSLERAARLSSAAKAADPTGHWSGRREPGSNRRWPGLGTRAPLRPELRVGEARAVAHTAEVRVVLTTEELHVVRGHEPAIRRLVLQLVMAGSARTRVKFAPVEGAAPLFTPAFVDYLVDLHDGFTSRISELLARRAEALARAHTAGVLPAHPAGSAATTGDWNVPPVPADLQKAGIEISGPCSITSMFINALNPGPEGERAEGDLDDDEDSGGHRLVDTVRAAHNRVAAVQRELHHFDTERKREYRVADGELPC